MHPHTMHPLSVNCGQCMKSGRLLLLHEHMASLSGALM